MFVTGKVKPGNDILYIYSTVEFAVIDVFFVRLMMTFELHQHQSVRSTHNTTYSYSKGKTCVKLTHTISGISYRHSKRTKEKERKREITVIHVHDC